MTALGVVFLPQLPPERLAGVARTADEAGLDELWLWEDCFRQSGIASAAAALAWTRRLRVGIGLLPVPLRNVALTAMEVANLERMFPGRLRLGVGHGVQEWMGQVGARAASPLTLLREHLDALRALLRGEQVSTAGRYVRLDRVALDWPPAEPPAVLAGAGGPRSLRLSGECADGTILTGGTSPARLREARLIVDEGRAAAARTEPHLITVYVHAGTGPDAARRIASDPYAGGSDPDCAITGDADAFAEGVARWAGAGADAVVLQPTVEDPDPEGLIRFAATQVKPQL